MAISRNRVVEKIKKNEFYFLSTRPAACKDDTMILNRRCTANIFQLISRYLLIEKKRDLFSIYLLSRGYRAEQHVRPTTSAICPSMRLLTCTFTLYRMAVRPERHGQKGTRVLLFLSLLLIDWRIKKSLSLSYIYPSNSTTTLCVYTTTTTTSFSGLLRSRSPAKLCSHFVWRGRSVPISAPFYILGPSGPFLRARSPALYHWDERIDPVLFPEFFSFVCLTSFISSIRCRFAHSLRSFWSTWPANGGVYKRKKRRLPGLFLP